MKLEDFVELIRREIKERVPDGSAKIIDTQNNHLGINVVIERPDGPVTREHAKFRMIRRCAGDDPETLEDLYRVLKGGE